MPRDHDLKALVRQRMAETGERYTTALAALGERDPDPRRSALAGLRSTDPEVRRRACRRLDDLLLDETTIAALKRAMADEAPRVRAAALHALTCEACKPDGCALDARALFETAAADPSAVVRGEVAAKLSWSRSDPWAADLLRRLAEDASPKVRDDAAKGRRRLAEERTAHEARAALPDALRVVTESHPGKWVAVAHGRVVDADRFKGRVRRSLRGAKDPEGRLYFVDGFPHEHASIPSGTVGA